MISILKRAVTLLVRRDRQEFELDIGWSKTYDELFETQQEIESELGILQRLRKSGRAILVGRGGSGKTCLMHRVAERAAAIGIRPYFIDLKAWKTSDYENWNKWLARGGNGTGFLLNRFATPTTSFVALDMLAPTTEKLLLVDGLNEISEPVGEDVLLGLEEFASTQIQASVLVADRLIRRDLPSTWQIGRVLPLSTEKIKQYVGSGALNKPISPLLELPFYLDATIKHAGDPELDKPRTQQEFLTWHTGLIGPDLERASRAAFSIYQRGMTRTFALAQFVELAGEELVARMHSSGILEIEGDIARFTHHLIHDALAARYLATAGANQWSGANLDAISFRASSFDTIVLIFEQLPSDQADGFLRRVYDWNLYAAGYALSERNPAHIGPSAEMEVVIFSMLGEKKLDQVVATALRAGDALAISRSPQVEPFRSIANLDQLFAAAAHLQSNVPWFLAWRNVFTRAPGAPVNDEEVAAIALDDSIMGWTWSNVLKRCHLTPNQQGSLRQMFAGAPSPTLQWRIVHVLGAFPSHDNKALLATAVEPNYDTNVRYGAVRSLAEMMSRADVDMKESIIAKIIEKRTVLEQNEVVLRELKRALLIRRELKPVEWEEVVLRIIREFYQHADLPETRDAWRKYAVDLQLLYGTA